MNKNDALTQEKLKELMHYDPETGIFTRRKTTAMRQKVGEIVGVECKNGYLKCGISNEEYTLHRLAWLYMYGEFPEIVDHINHNKKDNRIANLRDVDRFGNMKNMSKSKANTSGTTGVCYCKERKMWKAQIYCNGVTKQKRFKNRDDAVKQRGIWEKEFGFFENHGKEKNININLNVPIYFDEKNKKTMISLNFYRNAHYHTNNKVKSEFEKLVAEKLQGSNVKFKEYQIEYKLFYKNKVCDMMNIIAVVDKFLQDSLQELGIVENDNVQYCKKVMCEVGGQDKINPRVCVTILTFK